MTFRLDGKTAIVTGGTRGIGRAIVELLSKEGARVLFTGRDEALGQEVARLSGAHFLVADAADADQVAKIGDTALQLFGSLDILVNNAGHSGPRESIDRFDSEAFDLSIAVLLRAPWQLMSDCVGLMRKNGGGSVINIASVAGHRVGAASVAYAVSKAALIHLTRYAAAELGKDGVRVNSISPGFIATDIHTASLDIEGERADSLKAGMARFFATRQALPMTGMPDDVAHAALYLASDASRFISGMDLVIDGAMMWGQNGLK